MIIIESRINYSQLDKITTGIAEGSVGNIIHRATIDGKNKRDNFIILFHSASSEGSWTCFFSSNRFFPEIYYQKLTLYCYWVHLLLIQVIIFIFWRYLKSQKSEMEQLKASEKMLVQAY